MKKILMMIPILAAAFMINAAPSMSEDGTTMGAMSGENNFGAQKDECLLVAMNCPDQQDSYQERINKLQDEINKGTAVYTDEELNTLSGKLDETRRAERQIQQRW
jgi:hypothetical protein